MAKAFLALALIALLYFAAPAAYAQQSLTVPSCPVFASTMPAPSVSATYTSSQGLQPGTYYITYTTGALSSYSTKGNIAEIVVTQNTQSNGANAILTVNAPVQEGTQVNFYIGSSSSSFPFYQLYLVASGQSNSTTISSMPSTGSPTLKQQDATSCILYAIPVAVIGILLSMLLISVSYMLGEVFQVSGFKNWYKGEFWEVAKSIMVIAAIFSALLLMSTIAYALTGGTQTSASSQGGVAGQNLQTSSDLSGLYSAAQNYITTQLNNAVYSFGALFGLADGLGLLNSFSVSAWIPIPIPFIGAFQLGSSENLFQSSFIESNTQSPGTSMLKDMLTLIVMPMLIVFQLLNNMFLGIMLLGLTVFIPIGIVLRAIPFLRGLGGTMLAMGISISLIFPALLVGLNIPVSNYLQAPELQPWSMSCNLGGGALSSAASAFLGFLICTPVNEISSMVTGVGTYSFGWGLYTLLNGTPNIYAAMNVISAYTFPTILQLILFIIDLIITFALGDAIARMLGGSMKLSIGKFKIA